MPLSGKTPGATGIASPGPVLVASISLPGGIVVRTVSNPASIPDSQLFAVNNRPDAAYIVATDPRFTGQRPYVSSDYLFDLLRPSGGMPGAPTGNSVGAGGTLAGSRLGSWDALIPPGAKFLTPSGQPKRLGDGFYEQKAVSDQILATTGQRFLEKYSDNDTQYKALLAAGAKFAQDNGIKLGVALTEAQQRQLTTDLVWLVEQTVTLPDGTTETVLVPQVYLLVREGDLKGDGTLLAGRSVHLAVDGNATNSGTIGAREATVITAGNIVNQAGGTIQGGSVNLAARAGSEQSGLVDQGRQGRLERRTRYRADVDLGVGELRQQLGVVPDRRGARGCRQPLNAGRPRSGVDRRAGGRQG